MVANTPEMLAAKYVILLANLFPSREPAGSEVPAVALAKAAEGENVQGVFLARLGLRGAFIHATADADHSHTLKRALLDFMSRRLRF